MPCRASGIACAGQRSSRTVPVPPTAERCQARIDALHARSLLSFLLFFPLFPYAQGGITVVNCGTNRVVVVPVGVWENNKNPSLGEASEKLWEYTCTFSQLNETCRGGVGNARNPGLGSASMFPWLNSRATDQPRLSATINALRSDPGHGAPRLSPRLPPPPEPARPPPGHGKSGSRVPQGGRLWEDLQFSAALVRNMSPVFAEWLLRCARLLFIVLVAALFSAASCRASSCCLWWL